MALVNGAMVSCDRCGRSEFLVADEDNDWARVKAKTGDAYDICPDCADAYAVMLDNFINQLNELEDSND